MLARTRIVGFLGLVVIGLAGCSRPADPAGGEVFPFFGGHGRFLGVGIYGPGKPWTRIMDAQQKAATPSAQPIDDQVIIVVEDSRTGELRACGDLTGYCIGMNPWKTALAPSRMTPIKLTSHMAGPYQGDTTEVTIRADRPEKPAAPSARKKPKSAPAPPATP